MQIDFIVNFTDRFLALRMQVEFHLDQSGKEKMVVTADLNDQDELEESEINDLVNVFEELLKQKVKSIVLPDTDNPHKKIYVFWKKLDIISALKILLDHLIKRSSEEYRSLKTREENLITLIKQKLANKPRVRKQKVIFSRNEIIAVGPDNKYFETLRKNKRYIARYQHNTSIAAVAAFASHVCLLAIGEEHTLKTHFMTDTNNSYAGIFSKQLFAETLDQLATKKLLPTQNTLIEAGMIPILVAIWAFADMDGHPNNIFYYRGKLVLFDFDRWFFMLTCLYLNIDPEQPHEYAGKEMRPPKNAFPITVKDMKKFPLIEDAEFFWWLLYPVVFKSGNTTITNPLVEILKDLEKNPEVKYRAYRAFIRIALFQKYNIIAFAGAHFRRKERAEDYINLCMQRVRMIRDGLRQIEVDEQFIEKNPKVIDEVIVEFQKYNHFIKDKDEDFRVNLDLLREQASYLFKSEEIRLKHANISIDKAEHKLNVIERKYLQYQNISKVLEFKTGIIEKLEKLKHALTLKDSRVTLDEIQDNIDVINLELDIFDKNLLRTLDLIAKAKNIYAKINTVYLLYRLNHDDNINRELFNLSDSANSLCEYLSQNKLIHTIKELNDTEKYFTSLKDQVNGMATCKQLLFNSTDLPNANLEPIESMCENIAKFLKTPPAELAKKYSNTSLQEIYRLWFYNLTHEKHKSALGTLSTKQKSSLIEIKMNILFRLNNFICVKSLKIETIMEVIDIINIIEKDHATMASLKDEIEKRLKSSTNSFGFGNSDLKNAISEILNNQSKIVATSRISPGP